MAHRSMQRAATSMFGVALVLLIPLVLLAAPRSQAVAVLGAPGSTMPEIARIVADAGGVVVGAGSFANMLVARSEERGFVLRLYAAGAWLVLDPIAADLCGSQPAPPARLVAASKDRDPR